MGKTQDPGSNPRSATLLFCQLFSNTVKNKTNFKVTYFLYFVCPENKAPGGTSKLYLKKVILLLLPLVIVELEMAQGFASADKVREIPHTAT
jgi:hypothetical protein